MDHIIDQSHVIRAQNILCIVIVVVKKSLDDLEIQMEQSDNGIIQLWL